MPQPILRLVVVVASERDRFTKPWSTVARTERRTRVGRVRSSSPHAFLGMGVEKVLGHIPGAAAVGVPGPPCGFSSAAQLAPGVRIVGELEVLARTRIAECLGGFDPEMDAILFCDGPQCAATPDAIRRLLDVGYPPDRLLYYRGIHDWVTLGLPLERQAEALAGQHAARGPWSPAARGAPSAGWARELV